MNIKKEIEMKAGTADNIYLNNIEVDPLMIKAIMINEVVPADPLQDFYGDPNADYLKTAIPLLRGAGAVRVFTIANLVNLTLRVTIAKFGAPIWGVSMVWYAVPLGWLANFLISYGYYRTGKWKEAVSKTVD